MSQKVGNRSGMSGKGRSSSTGQRPARRTRDANEGVRVRFKSLFGYVPVALKVGLTIAIGVLVFLGYRAAASASFFQLRTVETRGLSRASNEEIETVVRRDVAETGVWKADLPAISKHLQRLTWVHTAIVTRVLPDGIRVRITERQPVVVIRNAAGRFIWVDDEAVFLGEMSPTDQMPTFFLRGWNEEDSAVALEENRKRVKTFLELQHDWEAQGLSERVSEVNLLDTRDVRVQLGGDDSQIEIRLGAQDHSTRLKKALTVLDTQRQTSRGPFISYIDISQGKRAVVGLVSGSRVSEDGETTDANLTSTEQPKNQKPADPASKNKERKGQAQNKKSDQRRT